MKTEKELRDLYRHSLLPDLVVLEKERKKVCKKLYAISGGTLAAVLLIAALTIRDIEAQFNLLFIFGIIWFMISAITYRATTRNYVSDFKQKIIRKIVSFIDETLTYNPDASIPMAWFTGSDIFKRYPDRYKGDDFVEGKLGATEIKFSEIHAEYKTETTDSKGRRQTHWHTIFKGLFFVADFNKNFKGKTVVLPDTAERIFGHLGKMFQSWNVSRDQLIKLEDVEFEKAFAVYGTDQIEARYILSTSLMKRITDFKEKTKKQIHLSFVNSQINIAISYKKNLFEPRVFQTILNFQSIQEYFDDLTLAVGIVEDLNLNTRIWGKE